MERNTPPSIPFSFQESEEVPTEIDGAEMQERLFSKDWLEAALSEACWRWLLLNRLAEFVKANFKSMGPLGMNYLIRTLRPIEKEEWEVFLEILRRLTLAPPRIIPQPGADNLFILLHQP